MFQRMLCRLIAAFAVGAAPGVVNAQQPLELYCQVENLERRCSDVPSVAGYRFLRSCVTDTLRHGGYVSLTDDYGRASRVPSFCSGASKEQIERAITAHGGQHRARLLAMTSALTFESEGKFAALTGVVLPEPARRMPPGGEPPFAATPRDAPTTLPPHVPERQAPAPISRPSTLARSTGTGFAIGKGDVLVTNEHVISDCSRIVATNGDETYDARVVARDAANDLAALRLPNARIPALPLSTGTEDLGGEITVLGYPLTSILGNEMRITTGVISSLSGIRGDRKHLQVSAAVQPGNSGGPVLDSWGNVSGVVVAKLGSRFSGENVNFAIRVAILRSFLEIHGLEFTTQKRTSQFKASELVRRLGGGVLMVQCF